MATSTAQRETKINLRAKAAQRERIDRAAEAVGQNRTSFMLEAALQRAEEVLADRTRFELDARRMSQFQRALDAPLPDAAALERLLRTRAPWDR